MEIYMKHIYKQYGDLCVLDDFSMVFSPNIVHCFFGPSGCGKTTLVNLLSHILTADKGTIEGADKKTVSYVFQEDRLLPWMTIEDNIRFVLQSRYGKPEAMDLVYQYLSLVDLWEYRHLSPDELSGGMKQRASIARAFAYGGDILILDEPFKGVHLEMKKALMDYILYHWHQKNPYIFFITHDVEEALYLGDEIYTFEGPPLSLKKQITIEVPAKERERDQKEMERYKKLILQHT